jgi:hypothetical protein
LTCPYCGHKQQTHEPDGMSANVCLTKCERCEREFWYGVSVVRRYWSRCKDAVDGREGE